ncbi:phage regulatory CII family protein [Methylobacillus caricis]|uniref:phage regulatory CII family protein n=1 Tax=Methylobacillus caricis TaxID=1971611 RepID=UPI001CFF6D3B|nr:phage regulatory CII family protein [Methylobacillus caricis]MCB5187394.1 phage regulatory CII family protein [Methylobacillus caricis]
MAAALPKNIHVAYHDVVHDYGIDLMASLIGSTPGVLYNKTNPDHEGHNKPTLADAVIATTVTGDKRIVQAFCQIAGGIYVESPDLSNLTTDSLLLHILKIESEGGDFYHELQKILTNGGRPTPECFFKVKKEADEWIAAIHEALFRIEEMSK